MYRTDVRAFPVSLRRSDIPLALAAALFVLTWPLEKRHLILTDYSLITGAYTESGTLALYVSDIAFLFFGAVWFWRAFRRLRNPHAETTWLLPISHPALWVGIGFVCWAAFRALPLAPSALGWYAALRIAQGFLLFLIAADVWRIPRVRTMIVSTLLLVGMFQAILGSAQVLKGGDLGLRFLGEQRLSLEKPGVSKVDLKTNVSSGTKDQSTIGTVEHETRKSTVPLGTKILRAYGTFPHPNVLGGFLAVVILYEIYLAFSQIIQRQGWIRWIYRIMFHLTFLGAILTFSRSSWLSIAFGLSGLVSSYRNIDRLRNIVLLLIIAVLPILAISSFSPLGTGIYRRFLPFKSDMFLQERVEFHKEAVKVIRKNPFIGVGTGNGLISLVQGKGNFDYNSNDVIISNLKDPWQYQYPHSVPMVVLLELGLVGLFLASAFVVLVLQRSARVLIAQDRGWGLVRVALFSAAVLSPLLLDHYLWTSQPGRILLWGLLGALAAAIGRQQPAAGASVVSAQGFRPADR